MKECNEIGREFGIKKVKMNERRMLEETGM
jgi:hypothetical protein